MEFSSSDKTEILLKAFDFNVDEINRKQGEQQKLFERSTSLLLASFAALLALSGVAIPAAYSIPVKVLATTLIAVPPSVFIYRIPSRRKDIVHNAIAVESVEEAVRLFEDGYYGIQSPFPKEWKGAFPEIIRRDRTPIYFAFIMGIMTICVEATIWLLL